MPAENHTVNPSFNITTENSTTNKPHLFIQCGKQGISFIQLDTEQQTFIAVQVFHFAKNMSHNNISTQIENIITEQNFQQQHFKKIYATWCFDEMVLVPQDYFDANNGKKMLELIYGDVVQGVVEDELIIAQQLQVVYKLPDAVKKVFHHHYPFCIQSHQSSSIINFDGNSKDVLYAVFYPDYVTVLLRMNGQLQTIQQFEFATPEDAVYHLLNVCQSFEAVAANTIVTVSGMIDTDSILYQELFKYFQSVNCAVLPEDFKYTEAILTHPQHYFSHLFYSASCVL